MIDLLENDNIHLCDDNIYRKAIMNHLLVDVNYLSKDSIVFDLGGYVGDYASKISDICKCKIFLFEPIKNSYDKCVERFNSDDDVKCFDFGLGVKTETIKISENGASSSSFSVKKNEMKDKIECDIRNFHHFMQENNINHIDLLKINIEGGEFDLLDYLLKDDRILKIKKFQIQFHHFVENAEQRRDKIREKLWDTHKNSWCTDVGSDPFYWKWEEWDIKK